MATKRKPKPRKVRVSVWREPSAKRPQPLSPALRLRRILGERPIAACNVEVLYRGSNTNRTVTLKDRVENGQILTGAFANYDFRAEARRWHGYPSARVQYRPHAEWFAKQPDFQVVLMREETEPIKVSDLVWRVVELEWHVAELLQRVPMTDGSRREGQG